MIDTINECRRKHAQTGLTTLIVIALTTISACTINPVTGDRELALVSAADELAIGAAQYAPAQQMQGGEYVLDRELNAYVSRVGQRLAAVSDRDLPYEFTVLNSSVPNAWALPGGKIAINRGLLLELSSEAELAAVLGHEIVHAAARHGALAMQRGLLLQGALLATAVASNRSDYSSVVVGAASVGAQLINQRNSRGAELESDEYGMLYMQRAGYDPRAAIELQQTFVRLSEQRSQQSGRLAQLFASHPPSQERVERNRETAARLPQGGDFGRESYAAATMRLRAAAPAYADFDAARAALANDQIDRARSLAQQAVTAVPAEAAFHALIGDIEVSSGQFARAIPRYEAALERDGSFFYYPLRLGLALQANNNLTAAEANLRASIDLLPTADAHYALGRISESRGNRATALEHYRAAAGASGQAGQAAAEAVVRMDLPQNPSAYLQIAAGLDSSSELVFELSNPTTVTVADVFVTIRYVGSDGQTNSVARSLYDQLPPGTTRRYTTGIGPLASQQSYQISLDRARVIDADQN